MRTIKAQRIKSLQALAGIMLLLARKSFVLGREQTPERNQSIYPASACSPNFLTSQPTDRPTDGRTDGRADRSFWVAPLQSPPRMKRASASYILNANDGQPNMQQAHFNQIWCRWEKPSNGLLPKKPTSHADNAMRCQTPPGIGVAPPYARLSAVLSERIERLTSPSCATAAMSSLKSVSSSLTSVLNALISAF
jgi:hypothetical protein